MSLGGVRLTMQVPVTKGVRVLVDDRVDEFRVLLGRWDIALEGPNLVVREAERSFGSEPLLKVAAE